MTRKVQLVQHWKDRKPEIIALNDKKSPVSAILEG